MRGPKTFRQIHRLALVDEHEPKESREKYQFIYGEHLRDKTSEKCWKINHPFCRILATNEPERVKIRKLTSQAVDN